MIYRTYSELIHIPTFEERLEYLRLAGKVGNDTFGFDRIFNQMFYRSKDWKDHMNPISLDDIQNKTEYLLNHNYLICVSHDTHNAIHYGTEIPKSSEPIIRTPNDTCPWKR